MAVKCYLTTQQASNKYNIYNKTCNKIFKIAIINLIIRISKTKISYLKQIENTKMQNKVIQKCIKSKLN